jgi:hypothetical protein
MNPDTWEVFHDGIISKIEGSMPGDLSIHIEITYLREMFPGEGKGFIVTLKNCSSFEYEEYLVEGRVEIPIKDMVIIAQKKPILLYVDCTDPVVIDCAIGTLRIEYMTAESSLDSGESVSDEQLIEASKSYWKNFGK